MTDEAGETPGEVAPSGPMISVCVPAHNGGRFIRETLDSVLGQRDADFEVVVIDNASTDQTPAILEAIDDPRLRVVRTPRLLPMGENWRFAMTQLRGALVKVVCADDLLRPGALAAQAKILTEDPSIALVASRRDFINADGQVRAADRGLRGLTGPCEARTVLRRQVRCGINQIGEPANVMFRMADYARTTGWNAHRVYPMDAQLWVELLRLGRLYAQPQTYAAFRLSGSNLSASHSAEQYAQTDELLGEVAREWGIPRWQGALGRLARRAVWAAWRIRIKLLARSGAAR